MDSEFIRKQVGKNIRKERRKLDLSMEQLAEMLDISSAFLGLIERGERGTSIKNLILLSKIFEIPLDDLVLKDSKTCVSENKNNCSEKIHIINCLVPRLASDEQEFIIENIKWLLIRANTKKSKESA